jgi:membrane protease YdiL (CAAX protease family)
MTNEPVLMPQTSAMPEGSPQVKWSARDAWLGLALSIPVVVLAGAVMFAMQGPRVLESADVSIFEALYLLPVVVILAWRKAPWRTLGFRGFGANVMQIGCGLLIGVYILTIAHNSILMGLGVETQGEALLAVLKQVRSPVGIVIGAVVAAPLAEEIFFRGFFFQGMRRSYGWQKAALISSALFGALHFQLAAFLPTFLMGYVFALLFNRSNSVWPGVILHGLINAVGVSIALISITYGNALGIGT